MKCAEVEKQMRGYLEDALPEDARESVRGHLAECSNCQVFELGLGTFASDLKQLALQKMPFDLTDAVIQELTQNKGSKRKKKKAQWLAPIKIGVWMILLIGIVYFAVRGVIHFKNEEEKIAKTAALEAPDVLQELEQIARRLGITPDEMNQSKSAEETPKTPVSARRVTNLQPLHMHLEFESSGEHYAFLNQIRNKDFNISFDSNHLLVFVFNQKEFEAFTALVKAMPELILERNLELNNIPEFDGTVKVSLYMKAPRAPDSITLSQHWHLRFNLPNRLLFAQNLHEAKIKFVYEDSQLWILEVAPSEFHALMKAVNNFGGVQAHFDETGVLPETTEEVPIRLSIYSEG
jgi:hypothetical protein